MPLLPLQECLLLLLMSPFKGLLFLPLLLEELIHNDVIHNKSGVRVLALAFYFHQSGILPAPSMAGMRILILFFDGWMIQAVASGIFISSPGWTS